MSDHRLWYRVPASLWTDALPLGNGRLGAMVYGGVARDELQLNEDTLWSGGPYRPANPAAREYLDKVRQLIFAGRYAEAERLANEHLMGMPYLQTSYQPAGRLLLDFSYRTLFSNYYRELDLQRAIATVTFAADGTQFKRESLVSAADGVLAVRLTADRPAAISFSAEFVSEQPGETRMSNESLRFDGRNRGEAGIPGQLRWAFEGRITGAGGTITKGNDHVRVDGADSALILVDIATSFRGFDDISGDPSAAIAARLDAASDKGWDQLLADHLDAHGALYDRFAIHLGPTRTIDRATDERIAAFEDNGDPGFAALYVHFGRYLTIASSQPGTQPANLQGIWNDEIHPPWGSKYTSNINLQMNYWLADPANLADCVEPLLRMVEDLAITGAETARVQYGACGWVLHHNTDVWRATAPIDGAQWGMWPTGAAWLCVQLWDHASFAGYPPDLVARLYPLLQGAAVFFLDTLVGLPDTNHRVTVPSVSPENVHPHGATICAGPAMDSQILRDLFDATAAAATRLDVDADLVAELVRVRASLPADRVGLAGQLQEWLEDWDLDVPEIHHRHVSHLYGLYPSLQITPARTPLLADAARKSLERRGDDATGWGLGWRINLWARLGDGDRAFAILRRLLHPDRSYRNLFDAHPPFQIDGNFGGAAGILEMLAQSDDETIHILPALPTAWPEGSVRGLRTRGGVTLDFSWEAGRLAALTAHSDTGYAGRISYGTSMLANCLSVGTTRLL